MSRRNTKKKRSVASAAIKTLSSQYSMYFDMVNHVNDLYEVFERELFHLLHEIELSVAAEGSSDNLVPDTGGDLMNQVAHYDEVIEGDPGFTDEFTDTSEKDESHPWLKKLFKKIAIHCHPDKVDINDHRKLLSYEAARKALDDKNEPRMISVGAVYDELPDIKGEEIKTILTAGINVLEGEFNARQKSLVWTWGMSEDNFEIKAKVLVQAMAERYNKVITEDFALRLVRDFFEVSDTSKSRTVGTRPSPGIGRVRRKND